MNVRCESCDTVYRVDPDRLPVRGVRARCTVCSHVIAIEGQSFGPVPETATPRTFAPGTQDRVANALGDAFIPPPAESSPKAREDAPLPAPPIQPTEEQRQKPVVHEETPGSHPIVQESAPEPLEEAETVEEEDVDLGGATPPFEERVEPVLHTPAAEAAPTPPPPPARLPEPVLEREAPVPEELGPQKRPGAVEPAEPDLKPEPPPEPVEPTAQRPPEPEGEAAVVPPWEEMTSHTLPPPPAPTTQIKPVAPEPPVRMPEPATSEQQTPKAPRPFAGGGQGGSTTPPAPPAQPDGRATRQRLSRPFSVPRGAASMSPPSITRGAPQSTPSRPSAPVFTPTPGRPVQPPPVPPRQPPPEVQARPPVSEKPVAPAAPAPLPPSPAHREPAGRPVNPFLSRDPRQKARRLARALISDMIVYQPEKRQRAMRDGNLKEAFNEEIKKSWEEFVEQVGHEIAESTTHFNDALNDILAGGQKVF